MSQSTYEIEIKLRAPFLTKSSRPGEYGIDSPCARNHKDQLYIPGSLLKGKVRESWTALAAWQVGSSIPNSAAIDDWFGERRGNSSDLEEFSGRSPSNFEPSRGRAWFSDLICQDEPKGGDLRVRIQIDQESGSAGEGMLQVLESPFAPGEEVCFKGSVTFAHPSTANTAQTEPTQFEKGLSLALRSLDQIGGLRGIGFGRVASAQCKLSTSAATRPQFPTASTLHLRLETKEPVCVTEPDPILNLFKGGAIIGGQVWKGAIAAQLLREHGVDTSKPIANPQKDFEYLAHFLSVIRFRQAIPAADECVWQARPQSLAIGTGKSQQLYDLAEYSPLSPAIQAHFAHETLAFASDWKSMDLVGQRFPNPQLATELRVRTAIDAEKRRAKDQQLFAYESVLPKTDGGRPVHWVSALDFHAVPLEHREKVVRALSQLLANGLSGIGKTKATFKVQASSPSKEAEPPRIDGSRIYILLRSKALMGSPESLTGQSGHEALFQSYAEYWNAASGGALALAHFYATQELRGGYYQFRRFQASHGMGYRPWLLTSEGSVFALDIKDATAAPQLAIAWTQSGLPLAGAMRSFYFSPPGNGPLAGPIPDWQLCPFVPENGFGEISINAHANWSDLCPKL
jgi:hypothetical protein